MKTSKWICYSSLLAVAIAFIIIAMNPTPTESKGLELIKMKKLMKLQALLGKGWGWSGLDGLGFKSLLGWLAVKKKLKKLKKGKKLLLPLLLGWAAKGWKAKLAKGWAAKGWAAKGWKAKGWSQPLIEKLIALLSRSAKHVPIPKPKFPFPIPTLPFHKGKPMEIAYESHPGWHSPPEEIFHEYHSPEVEVYRHHHGFNVGW